MNMMTGPACFQPTRWFSLAALLLVIWILGWSPVRAQPVGGDAHRRTTVPQLHLDHGQPWCTDASLREGMERIRAAVAWMQQAQASGPLSVRQSQALSRSLEDSVAAIVSQPHCKPGVDANLHILLGRLLAADGLSQVLDVLDLYPRYFDHPGWQPIDHDQSRNRPRSH